MSTPTWVPIQAVYIIHDRQIARHGGKSGLGDATLLESACARPENKFAYEDAGIFECGAAYAFGIAKAHAFIDGNKRTAFVTAATFLRLNGWVIKPDTIMGVRAMEDLATDTISEDQFCAWLGQIAVLV
jgi:death-on-curing protein